MANYEPVYRNNQGSFNNPRQKMWCVWNFWSSKNGSGWEPYKITNDFIEAKADANQLLKNGLALDKIMITEIVPIDTIMTPNV